MKTERPIDISNNPAMAKHRPIFQRIKNVVDGCIPKGKIINA